MSSIDPRFDQPLSAQQRQRDLAADGILVRGP
jgi:hypothetical protein